MKKSSFASKISQRLTEPNYPEVGLEFDAGTIRLAAISARQGKPGIVHLDSEPIPEDAMEMNPFKPNILSFEALTPALQTLWARSRVKSSAVSLLIQDRCALTFHLSLDAAPANANEANDIIRFKLRKNVPFRLEDARISYFDEAGNAASSSANLWVTLIPDVVLQQYEQFVQSTIGADTGLVDLATYNLINFEGFAANFGPASDVLFVNLNRNYISVAITQKDRLKFYRNRPLELTEATLEEALAEIHPAAMYYLDKLQGEKLEKAVVYSSAHLDGPLAQQIESELGIPADIVSLESIAGTSVDTSSNKRFSQFAPLLGLLISRKAELV